MDRKWMRVRHSFKTNEGFEVPALTAVEVESDNGDTVYFAVDQEHECSAPRATWLAAVTPSSAKPVAKS